MGRRSGSCIDSRAGRVGWGVGEAVVGLAVGAKHIPARPGLNAKHQPTNWRISPRIPPLCEFSFSRRFPPPRCHLSYFCFSNVVKSLNTDTVGGESLTRLPGHLAFFRLATTRRTREIRCRRSEFQTSQIIVVSLPLFRFAYFSPPRILDRLIKFAWKVSW